jgi:ABC-2 type transport system ATP-binding protein
MPEPGYRVRRRLVSRALAVAGIVGLLTALPYASPGAAADTAGPSAAGSVTEQTLSVPVGAEPDGTAVTLDASVYAPDASGTHPAVLLAHGFGGSKADLVDRARDFAGRGYVVMTWSARGFGASGGRIHLDDPDYEVADARKLVDALAARPEVRLDAGTRWSPPSPGTTWPRRSSPSTSRRTPRRPHQPSSTRRARPVRSSSFGRRPSSSQR